MPPHHGSHSFRPFSHRTHSGRGANFYLYEDPCIVVHDSSDCPNDGTCCKVLNDTGALESDFVTVFPGWNVWDVYQVDSLPFSIMMIGVDAPRQLRIWVEDQIRLGAPGASVSDSIDLKGGQIEILNAPPEGLSVAQRKEQVSGPAMVVNGPATLKTIRFFNRGAQASLAWPHDESYLLDKDYTPNPTNPATAGPGPNTIAGTVGGGIVAPVKQLLGEIPPVVYIGGAIAAGLYFFRKEIFSNVRRVRKSRSTRGG